ncbi:RNA 2',3'-cyclic phosphodiesterase [soil metagenome]
MRVFIGAWPSAAVGELVDGLSRPKVPGLRWTTPEQWHVTLRFCGDVAEGDLPALVDALRLGLAGQEAVAATTAAATARFGPSGILHLPVSGLDAVAARVRWASAPYGDHHDDRRFQGHLTLARAKRGLPGHLVGRVVEPASWTVHEVAVVASALAPKGARYRTVATVALDG